nr:immunoglobulin heavy chain junction region [Mus musculus]
CARRVKWDPYFDFW